VSRIKEDFAPVPCFGGNKQVKTQNVLKTLTLVIIMNFAAYIGSAQAHDLGGIVRALESSDTPESIKSYNRALLTEGDDNTRAVLVTAFQWPIPAKLTVCFDKGPIELRPKIARAMLEWSALTQGNIVFIFGSRINPVDGSPIDFKDCDRAVPDKIRIGFVRGSGHWSQIGTLSETVFPMNSMNLDFDRNPRPDDKTVREITLHETGHALAFHHEHQSPGAPCKNWAWDRILIDYNWPGDTREAKEKAMHGNLDRLNDEVLITGQHAYVYTAYDKQSIMHYSFSAEMFTDGTANPCYIPQPSGLSEMDKQAVVDAYAKNSGTVEMTRSIDQLLSNDRFRDFYQLLRDQKNRLSR
jgi:hypothetical protein